MINLVRIWFWPVLGLSILMSIVGIVIAGWLIINLPADHFVRPSPRPPDRHPVLHLLWILFRNLLGLLLVWLGIAMLIGPGQGVLTLLLGISLMDLPGKHRVVEWALTLKSIRKTLNWMRAQGGSPPLQFPEARRDDSSPPVQIE
jgi:hypothetical protein